MRDVITIVLGAVTIILILGSGAFFEAARREFLTGRIRRTLCSGAAAFLTFVVALVFAYLCWATGTRLI